MGMAAGGELGFLEVAAVYLGAATVAVPLFKRLKLGSVLGYLAAGVLIGPGVLGLIPHAEQALHVAEFGVVLLLFVIGLELKPSQLWRLRMEVFGLGAAQVIITGLMVGAIAFTTGLWSYGVLSWQEAVVAGSGLALSSTAFAVQLLREKGELKTHYGDRSFAILLFQDLAIVPLIAMVALLAPVTIGGEQGDSAWYAGLKALAAVGAVYFAGRYLLKPLLHLIAETGASEAFTATALLVVVGAALIMDQVGLSMAMGGFLAGVLLGETEFRHQLETDIEPFRGLLMGLFFISVGMNVNIDLLIENLFGILFGVIALVMLKALMIYLLARITGSHRRDAVRTAAVLSQGGEFGFVLFSEAMSSGLMGVANGSILTATVTLSMAMTPLLVMLADNIARRSVSDEDSAHGLKELGAEDALALKAAAEASAANATHKGRVIIAGFGRTGQVISQILRMRDYELILIDNNPRRIRMAKAFEENTKYGSDEKLVDHVYFGDARRLDTLAMAGAETAQALFISINDRDGARQALEQIRARFPQLNVYVITYDRFSMIEMEKAGAKGVERETFESAISLTKRALMDFGEGEIADEMVEEFRRMDARLLMLQAETDAREGLKRLRDEYAPGGKK